MALTQITTELDETYLPINKKSKNKEPTRWLGGLKQQGVATRLLQVGAREVHIPTLRAKKAAACLLWMSGRSREEIETNLMQHMRENVAAGAVNQVRSRTIDLLPVVISVAEILRDVDLAEQQDDLMLRLELGIPADLLPLARVCRGRLTRVEYLRLHGAGAGRSTRSVRRSWLCSPSSSAATRSVPRLSTSSPARPAKRSIRQRNRHRAPLSRFGSHHCEGGRTFHETDNFIQRVKSPIN